MVANGIEIIGTTIKKLIIENNIVDIEKDGKRNFGMNINEPKFQKVKDELFAQMIIDFEIEIIQLENQVCKLQMSIEGAFLSEKNIKEEKFKELMLVNGAAALIGISRGKIETITASIFNNGKIVIPFVNVVNYYKSLNKNNN